VKLTYVRELANNGDRRDRISLLSLFALACCALALMPALQAQASNKQKQVAKPNFKQVLPPATQARAKTPAQIPDAQVNRLMNMTPEEREKALANLPQQRRQALEQRLARLDQLPPEQRAELDRRFQEFQKLSRVRQQAVRDELQTLRGMRQPERRARINSPEFREQYSPEEIRLMKDVWNLQ
jgi:hypothetical protein